MNMCLLVFIFGMIGILVFNFSFVVINNPKRKRILEEVRISHSLDLQDGVAYPVRYSSNRYFHRAWKGLPWEGVGYLVIKETGIAFIGKLFKGDTLDYRFSTDEFTVQWYGKNVMKNGGFSWFRISLSYGHFYLTSETGIFIHGSKESTKRIYDELVKRTDAWDIVQT